jgi:hypothetical protein
LLFQQGLQSLTDQGVIIGKEDTFGHVLGNRLMSLYALGQSGGSLNFSEVETLESGACRNDGESHILLKYKDFRGACQSLARGHREESTACGENCH